jgi:hypothetical protein
MVRWPLLAGLALAAGAELKVSAAAPPPWLPGSNAVRHVIHVSIDGLGGIYLRDYLAGAPGDFPTFSRLLAEGAHTFNARCDYHVSLTEPNHASILTGRPVSQQPLGVPYSAPHGFSANYDPGPPWTLHNYANGSVPYKASVFDVVHDHGLSTAFFAGKEKFALFVRSYDAANGAPDEIGADDGRQKMDQSAVIDWEAPGLSMTNSSNLVTLAVDALSSGQPPAYTFLHLVDPDIFGHYHAWGSPQYRDSVRHADRQLGRLLAAIDASAVLSNCTALVVTADHGGGDAVGSHLYPNALTVYTVPLLIWVPGVPPGVDAYRLFSNRVEPGTAYLDFDAAAQPLRNSDSANIALMLLGLPPIPGSCLVPEFGPTPAVMAIRRTADGLTISWPSTAEGFGLEWSDDCLSPFWHPVEDGVAEANGRKFVVIQNLVGSPRRFYRLVKDALP